MIVNTLLLSNFFLPRRVTPARAGELAEDSSVVELLATICNRYSWQNKFYYPL
jgi:hypothetical protein